VPSLYNSKVKGEETGRMGALAVLDALGVRLTPRCTMNIFGLPMVGKSCMALAIARELQERNKMDIFVLAVEPSYGDEEYKRLIGDFLGSANYRIDYVDTVGKILYRIHKVDKPTVIIVDSISALADAIAETYARRGITEPRVIAGHVAPALRYIARGLKTVCGQTGSIGILISHATSTAGTGNYRGVVPYRPSLSARAGHYLSYEVFMDFHPEKKDLRIMVVTAARAFPEIEGNTVTFRLQPNRIEVIEKKKK